eukprot:s690_g17.t1
MHLCCLQWATEIQSFGQVTRTGGSGVDGARRDSTRSDTLPFAKCGALRRAMRKGIKETMTSHGVKLAGKEHCQA